MSQSILGANQTPTLVITRRAKQRVRVNHFLPMEEQIWVARIGCLADRAMTARECAQSHLRNRS
jgi:hypothetical protein